MRDWESLSHVRWDCKFHVVIVPKYRKRKIYGRVRSRLGQILRDLAKQKDVDVVEGSPKSDHVHMCLKIPPKYSVAHTIGFLKGKSAVRIYREVLEYQRVLGLHFWARGYCVSTVGLDEDTVRRYIREQEELEKQQEEPNQDN